MKKEILSLFLVATIAVGTKAQKSIIVNDTTALNTYFKNSPFVGTVVEVSKDNKVTITQNSQNTAPKYSESESAIIKSNSDILLKDIKQQIFSLDLPSELKSATLRYNVYFNAQNHVDSIASYLSKPIMEGKSFNHNYEFVKLSAKQEPEYQDALKKALNNYKNFANVNKPFVATGYIPLKQSPNNIASFFASKADTISKISLEGFGLTEFPTEELKRFKNLKEINLKDNYLTEISISKLDFPKLKSLSLQNNKLRDDSNIEFKDGLILKNLNLNNNYFTHIPKNIKSVQDLFLANNAISEFNKKDVKAAKKLTTLNLYSNNLTTISPKIKRLKKLKELDLYRNNLTTLPKQITKLKKLEALAISYNKLDILPENIVKMKGLKTLYTHHNQLKNLPKLPAGLEILDVGYNKIEQVAHNVSPLKGLKTLDYSNNRVNGDLDFLLQLPNIKEVYLFENNYAANEQEERYFGKVFTELVTKGVAVK